MKSAKGEVFIERLGRLGEGEGLPRTAGRMMAMLMIAGTPLGIDDLAAGLKVSRASVSTNGRLLESMGIGARVTRPGDRRDYLEISADPCSSLLSLGLRRLEDMREAIGEMRAAVPPSSPTATEVRQRLQRMERMYELVIDRARSVMAAWQKNQRVRTPKKLSRWSVARS